MEPIEEVRGTLSLKVYDVPASVAEEMARDYQRAISSGFWVATEWMPNAEDS